MNNYFLFRIASALEIKKKSESDNLNINDKSCEISETIATCISVTNANIFLIADKKSMLQIVYMNLIYIV